MATVRLEAVLVVLVTLSRGCLAGPRPWYISGLNLNEQRLQEARDFLQGRTLQVVTIQRPPFAILTMAADGQRILAASGYCFEMLRSLASKYRFRISLRLPYDGNWGNKLANGTFNGMVGMVNRSDVFLGVASFTITQLREEAIDFTRPYYEEPSAILIPPPLAKGKLLAVVRPFSWQVWLTVALLVLGVVPFLMLLERFGEDQVPKLYPHRANTSVSYGRLQWYIFGSVLAQGGHPVPTNTAARVLLGVWWIGAITIIASYTGTLIAFLTVPTVKDHLNSLEDLVSQTQLQWTYRQYTSHDSLFRTSQSAIYKAIGSRYTDLKVTSDAAGIAGVLEGRWAFIKEKSYLDFAVDEDFRRSGRCRLRIAKEEFFTAGFGWILPTGSPVKDLFNLEFQRMSESGLFNKWRAMYWPRPSNCSTGAIFTDVTTKPLMLEDVVSSLLVYGLGLLLAVLVFVLERLLTGRVGGSGANAWFAAIDNAGLMKAKQIGRMLK